VQDAAKRRGGGLLSIPWDPMSWGSVYSTHSAWLSNTQSLLLPRRLQRYAAPLMPDSLPVSDTQLAAVVLLGGVFMTAQNHLESG
jgi:hypothetical protein